LNQALEIRIGASLVSVGKEIGGTGGHHQGVPEHVDVDVDGFGFQARTGRIVDEHPPFGGDIVFAVVADDLHFHAVVGGEDAGADFAGFEGRR
jgi:hypothetical protein